MAEKVTKFKATDNSLWDTMERAELQDRFMVANEALDKAIDDEVVYRRVDEDVLRRELKKRHSKLAKAIMDYHEAVNEIAKYNLAHGEAGVL